ncbi:unnamed protein product [Triticum turgidum subsp. durum]|uniref:Plant heme peroxidase family profile domain-containing protein n=1 Tax=Triticum turgidum subsp. durum TaxID=4567 RepID=A0A9R0XWI8_TRITD|nr:unnamed protein product [Triticum turgidum subsp. durum]
MQEAVRELPSPSMTFPQLVALFAGKGLDVRDLVWLSGCAHHRHRPLLVLRRPPLQLPHRRQRHRGRPAPRRRLRGQPAAAQVQDGRPRRRRGDGPRQLPDVRPRLLPHCAQAQGPVPVRRRAGHRPRGAGRHRRRRVKPAGGVLPGVRAVHGEAGRRAGQDRLSGGDQEALRRRQQLDAQRGLLSLQTVGGCCGFALILWSSVTSVIWIIFLLRMVVE